MPCYKPLSAFKVLGTKGVFWSHSKAGKGAIPVKIPCGQCIGCRLAKSKDWRTRCVLEAKCHEVNSFVTLTYSDARLPDDFSVSVRDLQLFLKRLRELVAPTRLRFFACGEYGDKLMRPHYHLIIFGYDFPDRKLWRTSPSGAVNFRSALLEKAWTDGHSEIGLFSPQAAGYIARYCLKKMGGERAIAHYRRINPITGEHLTVRPEFITMSKKPGLGDEWFSRFRRDAFPSDFLIIDGAKVPVPAYFKRKLERAEPEPHKLLSDDKLLSYNLDLKRMLSAKRHADNNTPERLAVRETVQSLRAALLKRDME